VNFDFIDELHDLFLSIKKISIPKNETPFNAETQKHGENKQQRSFLTLSASLRLGVKCLLVLVLNEKTRSPLREPRAFSCGASQENHTV
jgi:hypothetical protein